MARVRKRSSWGGEREGKGGGKDGSRVDKIDGEPKKIKTSIILEGRQARRKSVTLEERQVKQAQKVEETIKGGELIGRSG